jgi:hypothetical protein
MLEHVLTIRKAKDLDDYSFAVPFSASTGESAHV